MGSGSASPSAFLAAGCRVVIADIELQALDAARAALGTEVAERVHSVLTDVADLHSVEVLAASTLDRFGQVDIVCNNAGVSTFNTIDRLTMADWHWVLGVDLWGVINGVHTFLPIILQQGTPAHIVNTASIAGLVSGVAHLAPYAVAKVGVVSLSETLRYRAADVRHADGRERAVPERDEHQRHGRRAQPAGAVRARGAHRRRRAVAGSDPQWIHRPGRQGAAEVAAMVVDAVRKNRFWVVSHGDLRPALEHRFAEILEATPYEP